MEGIRKSYGGVEVLHGVDFDLYAGEVHAVIGQNGAGKSTLMKVLNGVTAKDAGVIRVEGRVVSYNSPIEARKLGIGMIFQEFSLIPSLTISQNVFLTKEPRRAGLLLNDRECQEETERILDQIGASDLDPRAYVKDLSIGSQQMVEIAKALSSNSRIVIMDEPTASLSHAEIETLFGVIRRLTKSGIAIIYVSHYLRDIFKVCDRITVLRDGAAVLTKKVSESRIEEAIEAMLGARLIEKRARAFRRDAGGEPLLDVRNLAVGKTIRDVSFQIRRGEILGIAGLLGSGRSEIVGAIYGVLKKQRGDILIDGRKVRIRSAQDAIRCGIALVPEDRRKQGLIMGFSIRENIIIPVLKRLRGFLLIRDSKGAEIARQFVEKLSIKAVGPWQIVRFLSGGNQQKVVVARALDTTPDLLIAVNPSRGLDVKATEYVHRKILEASREGAAVVVISTDLDELAALASRTLFLSRGEIASGEGAAALVGGSE